MNDYLTILAQYKDIKELSDLVEENRKLREYYYTQQYVLMQQYINELSQKYFAEAAIWNLSHPCMPANPHEAFSSAEAFLWTKGRESLLKNGIKTQDEK